MVPGSSVVEQPAVNRLVAGSNPARGATLPTHRRYPAASGAPNARAGIAVAVPARSRCLRRASERQAWPGRYEGAAPESGHERKTYFLDCGSPP